MVPTKRGILLFLSHECDVFLYHADYQPPVYVRKGAVLFLATTVFTLVYVWPDSFVVGQDRSCREQSVPP